MRCWIFLFLIPFFLRAEPPPEPEPTPMELPEVPPGEVFAVNGLPGGEAGAGVSAAVDRLVMRVTGTASRAEAWRQLVKPGDRVGIKVATGGGAAFSTHRSVVDAVVTGLREAGVPAFDIIVFDRDLAALRAAGFLEKPGGYRVRAPQPGKKYDPKRIYSSMILGKLIWGDLEFTRRRTAFEASPLDKMEENLSSNSHFARVLTEDVTKVINLPVLSAHATSGLAGALFNITIPNVDNWRRFVAGPGAADPAIPEIYSDPAIAGKVVLHLMDGLVAQYAGGPEVLPNYALVHGTLYASRDPVALDTVALELIENWRKRAKLEPVGAAARYLESAREYGLGKPAVRGAQFIP